MHFNVPHPVIMQERSETVQTLPSHTEQDFYVDTGILSSTLFKLKNYSAIPKVPVGFSSEEILTTRP